MLDATTFEAGRDPALLKTVAEASVNLINVTGWWLTSPLYALWAPIKWPIRLDLTEFSHQHQGRHAQVRRRL